METKMLNLLLTLVLYTLKMDKIEIRQSIATHPWPMIIGLLLFIVPSALFFNEVEFSKENYGQIAGFMLSIILGSATLAWALSLKSYIRLEANGLYFRTSPLLKKETFVSRDQMESWSIEDYKMFSYKGLGHKRGFGGDRYIVMKFGKVLKVVSKDGKKYFLGIDSQAKVKRYIAQHWEENFS